MFPVSVFTQGSLLALGRSYGPGGLGVEVGRSKGSVVYSLVFYGCLKGSVVYLRVFYEAFCMAPPEQGAGGQRAEGRGQAGCREQGAGCRGQRAGVAGAGARAGDTRQLLSLVFASRVIRVATLIHF